MKPLLPIRHTQQDLFICDLFDVWKDDMGSMEHPIFSLSTKPDTRIRKYEHNGNKIEILPSKLGLATIHDKDVLLYLTSHIMADLNEKQEAAKKSGAKDIEAPPKTLSFTAYDMLVLTNRTTNNLGYKRLRDALRRLAGTRIETDIATGGQRITKNFGIIDSFEIVREIRGDPSSRMVGVEVDLSDWFYNALLGMEVLTISEKYFRLRKPIERRLYELSRKHCGHQRKWEIHLKTLLKKTGSVMPIRDFRRVIKKIVETDHMPDYHLAFDEYERDKLVVRPRKAPANDMVQNGPYLKTQTFENAEKILKPHGLDKYAVQSEWLEWMNGREAPQNPDGAFIGFCKMKVASL
ncbi:MAG: replication initiator protein A [bacterium]